MIGTVKSAQGRDEWGCKRQKGRWTGDDIERRRNHNSFILYRCYKCTAPVTAHAAKNCPWFRNGCGVPLPPGTCARCLVPCGSLLDGCPDQKGDVVVTLIGILLNTTRGHDVLDGLGFFKRWLPRKSSAPTAAEVQKFFSWVFEEDGGGVRQSHYTRIPRLAVAALDELQKHPFVYVSDGVPVTERDAACCREWVFDTVLPAPPTGGNALPAGVNAAALGKLAERNRLAGDGTAAFDPDGHAYQIAGVLVAASVSSMAGALFRVFDPRNVHTRVVARDWRAEGRVAARLGTLLHRAIEIALEGGGWSSDARIAPEVAMARHFYETEIVGKGLEVQRVELAVWAYVGMAGKRIAGSLDCLCRHRESDEHFIVDWKRIVELPSSGGGRSGWGRGAFGHMENIKLEVYSLQLHLYRRLVMQQHGLKIPVGNLHLVLLHPGNRTWVKVTAVDRSAEAEKLVENFEQTLKWIDERKAAQKAVDDWMGVEGNGLR